MPTHQSSSAHVLEETRQTKNLPDSDGTGTGLSQHCSASVFSSQTIDLQFLSGTSPSQQTESGPVAIKKDHAPSDEHLHHEQHPTLNAHQRSNRRVSKKCQQFQGTTDRTSHLTGEGWHATLLSMSIADQGQSNAVITTDPHTQVVKFNITFMTRKFSTGAYRQVSFQTKECHVKLDEIMSSKQPVTLGNLFWQRVMQEVHNKSMQQLMVEEKNVWITTHRCEQEGDRSSVSSEK